MVNRGVKLDVVGANPAAYAPGATITWWGFSSCTLNIQVLENKQFLGETIFSITCAFLLTSCVFGQARPAIVLYFRF